MDEDAHLQMRPYVRLYRIDSELLLSQSGTFSVKKEGGENVHINMAPQVRLYRIDSVLSKSWSETRCHQTENTGLHRKSVVSTVEVEPCSDSINHFQDEIQVKSEITPTQGETKNKLPTEVQNAAEKSGTQQLTAGYFSEHRNVVSASDSKTENDINGSEFFPLRQMGRFNQNKQQATKKSQSLSAENLSTSYAVDHVTENEYQHTVQTPKHKVTREKQKSGKNKKGDTKLQCTFCDKTFAHGSNLRRHKTRVHMRIYNYKYNCEDCEHRFMARWKYLEHLRRYHTFEKPYHCDICRKRFCGREGLRNHLMNHTGMKPVACKRCGQIFALEVNLKMHQRECKIKRNARLDHTKTVHTSEGVSEMENSLTKDRITEENKWIALKNSKNCELSKSLSLDQNAQSSRKKQQMSFLTKQGESFSEDRRGISAVVEHITENGNPIGQALQHKVTGEKHKSDNHESGDVKPKCQVCNKTFADGSGLRRHKKRVHLGIYNCKYYCEICKERFIARWKYLEHCRRYHTGEKPYQCDICSMSFYGRETLKRHLLNHTGMKPVTCKQCGRLFAREDDMKTHQLDCKTKKNVREISKTYASLGHTDHMQNNDWNAEEKPKKHTPSKSVQSAKQSVEANSIMDSHVSSQQLLVTPLQSLTQNQHCESIDHDICDTDIQSCSQEPRKKQSLWQTAKLESGNAPVIVKNTAAPSVNHAVRKRVNLRCNICNSQFETRGLLLHHKYVHNSKPFQCDVCSKLLTSCGGLRNHKKHVHDKNYDRKYVCDFCGKRFCNKNLCLRHIRHNHTGERPYSCHLCEKSYTGASSLKVHLICHSGQKPHTCTLCGKGFAFLNSLKQHLMSHSGETPYSCPICDRRFPNKTTLRYHRKSFKMPLGCNNCTKLFCKQSALQLHLKICRPKPIQVSRLLDSSKSRLALMEKENVHNQVKGRFHKKDANLTSEQNGVEVENDGNHLEKDSGQIQGEKENEQIQLQMEIDQDLLNKILFGDTQIPNMQSVSDQRNANTLKCDYCGQIFSGLRALNVHRNSRTCTALLVLMSNQAQNFDPQLLLSLQQSRNDKDKQTKVSDVIREKVAQFMQSKGRSTSEGLQQEGRLPHICDFCGKIYASRGSLYHHRRQVHLKIFKHRCELCGLGFYKRVSYQNHLNSHSGERPFECDICKRKFSTKSNLSIHILRHRNLERVVCSICNKSYATKTCLKSHIQTVHMGGKTYTCDICQKTIRVKDNLRAHMRSHTQEKKNFQCERCSKWFVCLKSLEYHLNKTCPVGGCYICQDCMKPFPSKKRLLWHMEQSHKEGMVKRPFSCTLCDKSFTKKHVLARHIFTHGNEKPFKCSLCPKAFFHQMGLKWHMISHQKEKRFTCSDCSKEFKFRNSLCLHRKKYCHANGIYLCRDCPSKFATKEALLSHTARQHSLDSTGLPKKKVPRPTEKLYKCEVCFKSFAYKQVLETHMNSHEGKQFKCQNCSKPFTYKNSLWLHMKKSCRKSKKI